MTRGVCGLAIAALMACGSVAGKPDGGAGDDDGAVGGDFTLAVAPASLSVPIASAGAVTLTVARTGAVGDITLAAQGLPAGVTAAFATNPIPEGTNTSEVTLTVAGGTAPTSGQITFLATAGATERTASLTFASTAITVAGKVRGDRAGVTVRLVGKAAVTSGAGGTFSFTDVIPPYDLYTVAAGGFGSTDVPTVMYYDDLTAPAPIVDAATKGFLIAILDTPTTVSGTKSGTGDLTSPVALEWNKKGTQASMLGSGGSYSLSAAFSGNSDTGRVMGFQFTRKTSGAPDTFLGFGQSAEFTVTKNVALPGVNVAMSAVMNTGTITGTVTAPAGFPNPTMTLNQQFGQNVGPLWTTPAAVAADATYPIVATAGKTTFHATTTVGSGATLQRSSSVHPLTTGAINVSVVLPAPASQIAPVDAATNVTTTTPFTWTAPAGVINELRLTTGGTMRAQYQVFTTASSATIPMVTEVPLPPNQTFDWTVNGYGPHATIDDAVNAIGLETVSSSDFDGPAHTFTDTASRTFTSAQ